MSNKLPCFVRISETDHSKQLYHFVFCPHFHVTIFSPRLTTFYHLFQYWTDIYLSWNPDNYPGVQNLRFPSNLIWVPDILLYNRSVTSHRSVLLFSLLCLAERHHIVHQTNSWIHSLSILVSDFFYFID